MGEDGGVIVDCAVYTDGKRRDGELPLEQALEAASEPDSFVWIGLHEPSHEEFEAVREEFGLHELAVEDAVNAHQRPKLEVYDGDLFVVLKTARYDDAAETVEFAELQLFIGAELRRHRAPRPGQRARRGAAAPSSTTSAGSAAGRWRCSTP